MTRALLLSTLAALLLTGSAARAAAPVAHIGTVALDGGAVRVLGDSEPALGPRLARDGRILFLRGNPASPDVWVMDGDGSGARRLADSPDGYGPIAWSPTGAAFATTGWDPSSCLPGARNCAVSEIRVHDAASGEIRSRLRSQSRGAYAYSWSPDGLRIASLGGLDQDLGAYTVEVANADGSGRRVLVRSRFPSRFEEIAWSPRGNRIAYVQRGWIWLVRPSGGKPERVAKGRRLLWSPRGELLYSIDGARRLFDPTTKRSRLLVRAPAFIAEWSADGNRLAYRVSYAGGTSTLAVVRASDGRTLFRSRLAGKVTSVDFTAGGTRLLYGVTFD